MTTDDMSFERTKCACSGCVSCCKRQPGPLAPGDFERIQAHLGASDEDMAKLFCASHGALVHNRLTGATARIGSITPQKRKGRCVFLDENDRCKIHSVAPFGCAYFDTHMGMREGHERSVWLARAQTDPEYQELRRTLPFTTSKPCRN